MWQVNSSDLDDFLKRLNHLLRISESEVERGNSGKFTFSRSPLTAFVNVQLTKPTHTANYLHFFLEPPFVYQEISIANIP